jgi:hypothetical protein
MTPTFRANGRRAVRAESGTTQANTTVQRRYPMPKWIVVTEVESEVDPAVFSYVNGTTLISSQLKQGEDND